MFVITPKKCMKAIKMVKQEDVKYNFVEYVL